MPNCIYVIIYVYIIYIIVRVACDETSPVARRSLSHSVTVAIARRQRGEK